MNEVYIPMADQCVVRNVLERQAIERGGKVFATFACGQRWTFSDTLAHARSAAAGLRSLGVRQGDHVFCWAPNGTELIQTWFGANYLGAVFVPVNLAYRGNMLKHVFNLSAATVAVVHEDLVDRLLAVHEGRLTDVVVVGNSVTRIDRKAEGVRFHAADLLHSRADVGEPEAPIRPQDNIFVIYTSGTTGKSKAVLCSYSHLWHFIPPSLTDLIGEEKNYLVNLPLFHAGATSLLLAQLIKGGSVTIVDSFKTQEFWNVIRRFNITSASLIGSMVSFVLDQPESADELNHSLKTAIAAPFSEEAKQFGKRFGVRICTAYGMTEIGLPLAAEGPLEDAGIAGRPRPGVETCLVDDDDIPVPRGEVGELLLRASSPWTFFNGYHDNAEATAAFWRNGWAHTGDLFRVNENGDYYFAGRKKDAIRRRGENISAIEVEEEIHSHPAVKECAVVGVRSELLEDEVLACIILNEGQHLEPAEIFHYLVERLPHFMLPRYIRIAEDLPRTETHRIKKYELREAGVTSECWDRVSAGIDVKRESIGSQSRQRTS